MKKLNNGQILEEVNKALDEGKKNDISVDFCADRGASESAYICDAFSEYADSRVDIYTADLWKWAAENYEYIDEARAEFGAGADILDDLRAGQFLQNERALYEDIDGIKEDLARQYINNVLINIEAEETTVKEAIETLKDDLANIDNNDRLDAIADACNIFIETLRGEADAAD